MAARTRRETIVFAHPFTLRGLGETLPAGSYTVDTDEERIEGASLPVYRRTRTLFFYRARGAAPGLETMLSIDPADLAAALRRDAGTASGGQP
jgi:hypothetical protein